MPKETVLSRHRLPRKYRISLAVFWIVPVGLLIFTILFSKGFTTAIFDPRFLVPIGLMLIPALYIWHEGVDVLPCGIIARVHWPRYYPYPMLDNWYFDSRSECHILSVWDKANGKVLECHAGHLTELPTLLTALKTNLRYRNWPT